MTGRNRFSRGRNNTRRSERGADTQRNRVNLSDRGADITRRRSNLRNRLRQRGRMARDKTRQLIFSNRQKLKALFDRHIKTVRRAGKTIYKITRNSSKTLGLILAHLSPKRIVMKKRGGKIIKLVKGKFNEYYPSTMSPKNQKFKYRIRFRGGEVFTIPGLTARARTPRLKRISTRRKIARKITRARLKLTRRLVLSNKEKQRRLFYKNVKIIKIQGRTIYELKKNKRRTLGQILAYMSPKKVVLRKKVGAKPISLVRGRFNEYYPSTLKKSQQKYKNRFRFNGGEQFVVLGPQDSQENTYDYEVKPKKEVVARARRMVSGLPRGIKAKITTLRKTGNKGDIYRFSAEIEGKDVDLTFKDHQEMYDFVDNFYRKHKEVQKWSRAFRTLKHVNMRIFVAVDRREKLPQIHAELLGSGGGEVGVISVDGDGRDGLRQAYEKMVKFSEQITNINKHLKSVPGLTGSLKFKFDEVSSTTAPVFELKLFGTQIDISDIDDLDILKIGKNPKLLSNFITHLKATAKLIKHYRSKARGKEEFIISSINVRHPFSIIERPIIYVEFFSSKQNKKRARSRSLVIGGMSSRKPAANYVIPVNYLDESGRYVESKSTEIYTKTKSGKLEFEDKVPKKERDRLKTAYSYEKGTRQSLDMTISSFNKSLKSLEASLSSSITTNPTTKTYTITLKGKISGAPVRVKPMKIKFKDIVSARRAIFKKLEKIKKMIPTLARRFDRSPDSEIYSVEFHDLSSPTKEGSITFVCETYGKNNSHKTERNTFGLNTPRIGLLSEEMEIEELRKKLKKRLDKLSSAIIEDSQGGYSGIEFKFKYDKKSKNFIITTGFEGGASGELVIPPVSITYIDFETRLKYFETQVRKVYNLLGSIEVAKNPLLTKALYGDLSKIKMYGVGQYGKKAQIRFGITYYARRRKKVGSATGVLYNFDKGLSYVRFYSGQYEWGDSMGVDKDGKVKVRQVLALRKRNSRNSRRAYARVSN